MKKITILLLLISLTSSNSQTKYFIYFKDKGINKTEILSKASDLYNQAISSLSEKSIERRKKTMGNDFITYEDLPVKKDYLNKLSDLGIKVERKLKWFNAVSAYLNDDQKKEVLNLSFVYKVEPVKTIMYNRIRNQTINPPIYKNSTVNSFDYGPSFGQDNLIDIPEVQSKGINGEGVIIGLLDSGFRWKMHESLSARKVIAEYDFVFNDSITANQANDIPEQDVHGTGVFSIIGGFKEGEIIGPAFDATYVLAKTEDERSGSEIDYHEEEDNYARALIWMDSIGVDITSTSLGYNYFDTNSYTYADMNGKTTIVTKAAELAFKRGILTINAAGNEGKTLWHYITAPADGFNTIAVGAVDNQNNVAGFSSRGPTSDGRIKPDIVAPGVNVFHAYPSDSSAYAINSGTSESAPLAAGTAALLLSAYPYLTNVQARDILLRTADNFYTPDNNRGYGLVSASKAVSFPNLEYSNGEYKIHKIFLDHDGIEPSTVNINYFDSFSGIKHLVMNYDGKLKFKVTFPIFSNGTEVEFYFTYTDSSGQHFREPENINYSFRYGNLLIQFMQPVFIDSVLDQNRPNPFSNSTVNGTKIRFRSAGNEKAQVIVYNILGERVKVLFDGISWKGINTIYWDGTTSSGAQSASGIYIYTLNLAGKYYSRKMIYLK